MLVGELDVETDGISAGVERAAIGCFHHTGATAGHDHHAAIREGPICLADQATKFTRHVIVAALRNDALGNGDRLRRGVTLVKTIAHATPQRI